MRINRFDTFRTQKRFDFLSSEFSCRTKECRRKMIIRIQLFAESGVPAMSNAKRPNLRGGCGRKVKVLENLYSKKMFNNFK